MPTFEFTVTMAVTVSERGANVNEILRAVTCAQEGSACGRGRSGELLPQMRGPVTGGAGVPAAGGPPRRGVLASLARG